LRLPCKGAGIGEASKIGSGDRAFFGSMLPRGQRHIFDCADTHASRLVRR
jgi:hypothetical protein